MEQSIFSTTDPTALDVDRVGPKAGNLAALGRAGLPIPDGFCIDSGAYRRQLASFELGSAPRGGNSDEEIMAGRPPTNPTRLVVLGPAS